jgi:hypothetical protein
MQWIRQGLVFEPSGEGGWINTHAQVPTALVLPDRIRVFFAARPRPDLSLPTFVDLDRNEPARVLGIHDRPILDCGEPGTFDADGVMPSSAFQDGDEVLLFYSGWCRLGGAVPYNNATGLARSNDGGETFTRAFKGPILDRTPEEPWSATSPTVLRDGERWHMWYSSGTSWIVVDGKYEHVYVIKHAVSADGRLWHRENRQLLTERFPSESQTKPTVAKIGERWHMWFCYRGPQGFRDQGQTYRIGHAWSDDLEHWTRDDEQGGMERSSGGWDSQMVCYPEVVAVGERLLLFYNGNGFGAAGFGYATLSLTNSAS